MFKSFFATQIDAGADNIAKQCRSLIVKYKEDVSRMECTASARDHYSCVSSGLDTYLQSVVSIHSGMRAVRVSRHLEMKKLSRLEVTSAESRAAEIGGPNHHTPIREQVCLDKLTRHKKYRVVTGSERTGH